MSSSVTSILRNVFGSDIVDAQGELHPVQWLLRRLDRLDPDTRLKVFTALSGVGVLFACYVLYIIYRVVFAGSSASSRKCRGGAAGDAALELHEHQQEQREQQDGTTTTRRQPSGSGATPQCQLTQEKLDDLRKEYDAVFPDDYTTGTPTPKATRIFNRDFVAGTEEDPKCKCGRHIREHPTQQQQQSGTTSASLDRAKTFLGSLAKPDFGGESVPEQLCDEALAHFKEWMDSLPSIPDGPFCIPHQLKKSWAREEWLKNVVDGREQLRGLKGSYRVGELEYPTSGRDAQIVGIHAGTGCGKTHALLDAGKHLNATTEIYITYNLDQDLSFDREKPRIAVLLRILMRCFDKTNRTCGVALAELITTITSNEPIIELHLIKFLVWYFCKSSKEDGKATPHLVVTVDEVRKLLEGENVKGTNVQDVASALGKLAFGIETNEHNVNMKCTVIVSALTEATFKTVSGRDVQVVMLPPLCKGTRDFIVQEMFPEANELQKAMIAACAGSHPRSIVVACEEVKKDGGISVQRLTNAVRERLSKGLIENDKTAVRDYLKDCVRYGALKARSNNREAEIFMDKAGSIPPALVCVAFEVEDKHHTVDKLFEALVFTTPTKQLELIGYHYDRFRAHYVLPVVPYGIEVCIPTNGTAAGAHAPRDSAWFKQLTFPEGVADDSNRDENSLFFGKNCARTKHTLKLQKYLFPEANNHPYIDRACLAFHPTDRTTCLVLYQDKINNDLPAAVKGLNAAADILSKETGAKAVLCIAQAIAAPVGTRAQDDFHHPYVIIRESEVQTFYTPSFASAVVYARQGHLQPP